MDDDKQRDVDLLKQNARLLSEHFDTVQIFATRHRQGGTVNVCWGSGNWFARYGFVKLWTMREEDCDPQEESEDL